MGFLDRMVGDLIARETGLPVRKLMRRGGGSKLLMMGGAALAGALASETLGRGKGQGTGLGSGSAPGPGGSRPGPPPPPLPPAPAGGPPPPLPPLPEAAAAPTAPPASPPDAFVFTIVRTLVAAALADGRLEAEERASIQEHLRESNLRPEQIEQIHQEMVLPASPEELAAEAEGDEARDALYRFAALVARSDGEVEAEEGQWLDRFAAALGLDADQRHRLEAELGG